MNSQAMSPQLELKDFARRLRPADRSKAFEEQQKKLQEELQSAPKRPASGWRTAVALALS